MENCKECKKNVEEYIKCDKCLSIFCSDCCKERCRNCKCSTLYHCSKEKQISLSVDDTLTTKNIYVLDKDGIIREINNKDSKSEKKNNEFVQGGMISLNKFRHCKKKILNCSCCKGKKCDKNYCFCYDCMQKNIKKIKLPKALINKKERIATRIEKNGKIIYCCRGSFDSKICNENNICPECLDLNNNLDIYQNLFKNKFSKKNKSF